MKSISVGLDTHMNQEVTTLATCWLATLANGSVFGFTSHTSNILLNGVIYYAATGYTPTAVASNSNLAVDNLEVMGSLDDSQITDADINSGLWDYADIQIFQINYLDTTLGFLHLRSGKLGEIKISKRLFSAELRGMAQQLQQTIGLIYSAACRANLGDVKCGINLPSITVTGTVTSLTNSQTFTDSTRVEAADHYGAGLLTFTSGGNIGLSMEVKSFNAGTFTLQLPFPYLVQIGDAYSVYPGCRKRFDEDCKTKHNNVVNFRGEPHVPGVDKLIKIAGV